MFRIIFLILLSSLSYVNKSAAAETSRFDSIYVNAASHLAGTDVSKAIKVADSLIEHTVADRDLMKSYMLMATLKSQVGKTGDALSNALKAGSIAKTKNFTDWKIRISGFLSSTFRSVNLIEEAKTHLDEAEKTHRELDATSPSYFLIKSFLHQEKALYYLNDRKFVELLQEIEKSEKALKKVPIEQVSPTFQGLNYQLRGGSYMALEKWDDAENAFKLGLRELQDYETELKGFIYVGLAQLALHKSSVDTAFSFLKKAEGYIESSDNFKLKSSVFKAFSECYEQMGDKEKALAYKQSYLNVVQESASLTSSVANRLVQDLYIVKDAKVKSIQSLIIVAITLILLILFVLIVSYLNRKKDRARYEEIIKNLKKKKSVALQANKKSKPTSIIDRPEVNTLNIPKETENRLLTQLEKMEEDLLFLNPDMTLSVLSAKLETNPKYLSYIINTYKEKDFRNYINGLRIDYAIMKLETDPKYLQYKLAIIAEECGFSSHSKFASIFKSNTGLSPSVFISHLKKDKEKS